MSQSENRRRELLNAARSGYKDRAELPLIHPRYGQGYDVPHGDKREEAGCGVRIILCCLLFLLFIAMDRRGITIQDVDSRMIVRAVEEDTGILGIPIQFIIPERE